jgi:hypothetical protein
MIGDTKIQEAIADLEQLAPSYCGLFDSVKGYHRIAAGVGDHFEVQRWSKLHPMGDPLERLHGLFLTFAWDLRAIHHLVVFDVDQLLELIDAELTSRRFRAVVMGVRAILEHAAITEAHLTTIRPRCELIRKFPVHEFLKGGFSKEHYTDHIQHRLEAVRAIRHYLMAQSFNWKAFDDLTKIGETEAKQKDKALMQFHAGPQVKNLPWIGAHLHGTTLYWWYNLLCDYVHPNHGAKNLFVNIQTEEEHQFPDGVVNRLYKLHLCRRPEHLSALRHVVSIIYLPLREALSRTALQIQWIASEQRRRYQDLRSLERRMGRDTSMYFRSSKETQLR